MILGALALLSLVLTWWQWLAGRRFPLHQRTPAGDFAPSLTLLKSLKGCDDATEACLRSWFVQEYGGPVQIVFGVAAADDPVCAVVQKLMGEFPDRDARLIVCGPLMGANLKVSKLAQLEPLAKYETLVISDADVRVPPDFLAQVVAPLKAPEAGLVNCFYRLANPTSLAMRWEAVAVNADFWSQVLQSQGLKPLDFALGAVMVTRRQLLREIGGLESLADCLADDFQLGNRIARRGHKVVLSPVVVECWDKPMGWGGVWKHQLRWARTIRVCRTLPYFLSILSNGTLWPLVWVVVHPSAATLGFAAGCWFSRVGTALDLERILSRGGICLSYAWLVPVKDLLQVCVWLLAFLGNRVEWRGEKMRLRRDGTLARLSS